MKCDIHRIYAHNATGLVNVPLASRGTAFCFVPSIVTQEQLLNLLVLFLSVAFMYQLYIFGV